MEIRSTALPVEPIDHPLNELQEVRLTNAHSGLSAEVPTCVWCRKQEPRVTFKNRAHIVPQSLGGKRICNSVCDECNSYFGRTESGRPAIETVLKETLGITRASYRLYRDSAKHGKREKRFSSIYFNADFEKRSVTTKPAYRLQHGFQEKLSRQFRRGIYKLVLETIEADTGSGLDDRYNFMREFARYDLGDYPVFYFLRRLGVVLTASEFTENPQVYTEEEKRMKYLHRSDAFFEFELFGHVFGVPLLGRADLVSAKYARETRELKHKLFCGMVLVRYFTDVDLLLKLFQDDGGYERWLHSQYGARLLRF